MRVTFVSKVTSVQYRVAFLVHENSVEFLHWAVFISTAHDFECCVGKPFGFQSILTRETWTRTCWDFSRHRSKFPTIPNNFTVLPSSYIYMLIIGALVNLRAQVGYVRVFNYVTVIFVCRDWSWYDKDYESRQCWLVLICI